MEPRTKTTKNQHVKAEVPAQLRRVKNIIKNDNYTIIRSPPLRCRKSSKRFKTGAPKRQFSVADPNLSMSPFELMESWIDIVAATSTPMMELVKSDSNDKRINDNSLLEDSLTNSDLELQLSKHQTCKPNCKCETCEKADKVAGKLFELTLSEDEGDAQVNGESRVLRKRNDPKEVSGRNLRRRKVVSYKEDSEYSVESAKLRGKKKQQSNTRQVLNEKEEANSSSSSSSSFLDSSGSSQGLSSSVTSDSDGARSGQEAMLSNCSVSLAPLSSDLQKLHLKCDSNVNKEPRHARLGTKGSSKDTENEEELECNSSLSNCSVLEPLTEELQKLHLKPVCNTAEDKKSTRARLKTRGHSQEEESQRENKLKSNRRRLRTRGNSTGDESESTESDVCDKKELRCVRLRTNCQSQNEKESDEDKVSNSRKIRTRGKSVKEDTVDHICDDAHVALSSIRVRTRGQSKSETDKTEDEEEELPVRKLRTRVPSKSQSKEADCDQENVEKEDGFGSRRIRTRGQSRKEEDDDTEESIVESNRRQLRSRRIESSEQSEDHEESEEEGEHELSVQMRRLSLKEKNDETQSLEGKGDEPMYPVTPKKKHLTSFHTDSFKEVFTPKKHKDTGLPVTGREKVLQQCEQSEPISFTECMSPTMLNKCVKIGEGVYGEVFRTTNSKRQSVAIKIIPIEGNFEVNEEPQKTFDEMLPEIVISRELSFLCNGKVNFSSNFIGVNNVSCVQGCYPDALLKEWDRFDERKGSENDRPDIFDEEQLYIVFEFADGGSDLEGFEFNNLQQAVSILQQVASALAVAEKELEFEHRDLHWGNVLIRSTRRNHVNFQLGNEDYSVESHGLEAGIIDFTLSRLQKDECTIFCDLAADPTLFDGTGDYQFQVYRKMKKENDNNWEPFMPHTNVLWLHYLTDKLINSKTYENSNSKAHKSALANLRLFYRHLLSHSSAEEVVMESELFNL